MHSKVVFKLDDESSHWLNHQCCSVRPRVTCWRVLRSLHAEDILCRFRKRTGAPWPLQINFFLPTQLSTLFQWHSKVVDPLLSFISIYFIIYIINLDLTEKSCNTLDKQWYIDQSFQNYTTSVFHVFPFIATPEKKMYILCENCLHNMNHC